MMPTLVWLKWRSKLNKRFLAVHVERMVKTVTQWADGLPGQPQSGPPVTGGLQLMHLWNVHCSLTFALAAAVKGDSSMPC